MRTQINKPEFAQKQVEGNAGPHRGETAGDLGKYIEVADDLAYARQQLDNLKRLFTVELRVGKRWKKRMLLVEATNPVRAAEIAVESCRKYYGMPHKAFVCEYRLRGVEGIVKAANTNGDIEYDVNQNGNVTYCEFSMS